MTTYSKGIIIGLLFFFGESATQGATVCQRQSPEVTLIPSIQYGFPVGSLSYSVEVKNNDSSDCPESIFSLSSIIPAGLAKCLSQSSLAIAPGDIGLATLTVSSTPSTPPGNYSISVQATNSSSAGYSGTGTENYFVEGVNFQVVVSSDKKIYSRSSVPYYAKLTARTTLDGVALSNFPISGTLTWPNGQTETISLKTTAAGTRWFGQDIQMSSQVGTYQFSITAIYQGMTISRSTSFVVN